MSDTDEDIMVILPYHIFDYEEMITLPLAIDQRRNRINFRFQSQRQLLELGRNAQRKAHIVSSALYCKMMRDMSIAIPKETKSTQTRIKIHPDQQIIKINVLTSTKMKDFSTQTEDEDIKGCKQEEEDQSTKNAE